MADLRISLGENFNDVIELYWRAADSTIKSFNLYASSTGDPTGVFVKIKSLIPNYPADGPLKGSVVCRLSRVSLGTTPSAHFYFRVTSINAAGVESVLASSPTKSVPGAGVPRYARDVSINVVVFPINPQFNFGFWTKSFLIINKTGVTEIEYSFDGITVHGKLGPINTVDSGKVFDFRTEHQIFCRIAAGAALVRLEAWDTHMSP